MPAALLTAFHSTADATAHDISLTGKTNARDLLVLIASTATPTLPANWTVAGSFDASDGGYTLRMWRLAASRVTAAVTTLHVALSASRGMAAIVWQDDVDRTSPQLVFEAGANVPTGATPALWGTGLHTFTTRSEAFAFFFMQSTNTGNISAFDLVSYDNAFAELGDTGVSVSAQQERIWMARHTNFSVTNDGVTATANGARPTSGVDLAYGASGMIAYQTGSALPLTALLDAEPTAIVASYELGGDLPSQDVLIENAGGGGTLDWTASAAASWVTLSPSSGTGVAPGFPDTMTVSMNPVGKAPGNYLTTITVTSATTLGSLTISVDLTISAQDFDHSPEDRVRLWRAHNGFFRRVVEAVDGTSSPEAHGARGDGWTLTDAAIDVNTAWLDSALGRFKSSDVGKWFKIRGAGLTAQGSTMVAQVVSYISSTRVELDRDAAQTVSGAVAVYGNDDVQAWRDAVEQLTTDNIANGRYSGELVVPRRYYVFASSPVAGGVNAGNHQVPLTWGVLPTSGPKFVMSIQGPGDASHFYHWRQKYIRAGAVIDSFLLNQGTDATYGVPSVLGSPTSLSAEPDATIPFSNVLVYMDGISVLVPYHPTFIGVDMIRCAQGNIGTLSINADGTPGPGGTLEVISTSEQAMALRMPRFENNDNTNVWSYATEGFFYGLQVSDHFTAQRIAAIYCDTALYCSPGGSAEHGGHINYMSVEASRNGIVSGGSAGGKYALDIDRLDIEVAGSGGFTFTDVNDTLDGTIYYGHNAQLPPTFAPKGDGSPSGRRMRVIDNHRDRGPATAPTLPASTTRLWNPFYRDAAVYVTGGTVSQIQVNGTATGTTSGLVIVPTNGSIALTYSSAPSWTWSLF